MEHLKQLWPYHHQLQQVLQAAGLDRLGVTDRLAQGVSQISWGLQTNTVGSVAEGVEQLVGLGPGLTPLGDDLLLGLLGGLYLAAPPLFRAEMVAGFCAGIKYKRTTRLSWLWLHHALAGEFSEVWHQLGAALTAGGDDGVVRTLARIAASGATSGLAALSGLYHCWSSLPQAG
jgi:hypothetical protein